MSRAAYRYYEADDGTRFCFASDPTFECPTPEIIAREPEQIPAKFERASEQLGIDLLVVLRRAHGSGHYRHRDPESDRLTDRCEYCRAKMKRHGFRVWSERDREPVEVGSTALHEAGLFNPPPEKLHESFAKTKREAREWALAEMRKHDAASD